MFIDNYPGLKRVALEIAYDNGMININEPENEFLESLEWLAVFNNASLTRWSDFIEGLSQEQVEVLAAGEENEIEELLCASGLKYGDILNSVLNMIFERG